MRSRLLLVLAGLATAGCATTRTGSANGDITRVVSGVANVIPSGTVLQGRFDLALGTDNRPGDRFTGRLNQALRNTVGDIVIPRDAALAGHVVAVTAPADGRPGSITLRLSELTYAGRLRAFNPEITDIELFAPSDSAGTSRGNLGAILSSTRDGTTISLGTSRDGARIPQASTFWIRLREDMSMQ